MSADPIPRPISLAEISRKFFDQGALSRVLDEVLRQAVTEAKADAPVDTGALQRGIGHQVSGLKGEFYSSVDYAAPVELGHRTASGSTVAPRPHMEPAFEKASGTLLREKLQLHAQRTIRF
jgi:hypothetical protein